MLVRDRNRKSDDKRVMATTIDQAVYPLLLTSYVLGLGVYSPEKLHLSIIYNLTVWIVYICLFYYIVVALKVEVWYISISTIVETQITILTSITSVIISVYQNKRFRIFMKRLTAVDNTLEELGTPKIYRKLHVRVKKLIIGWLVCINAANISDVIWWFYAIEDRRCIIIPYITNYSYHVNVFVDLLFVTFLWYIGTRFDKVNEHIRCLLIKQEHELRRTWKKTILTTHEYFMCTSNYKRVLWTSMHLHLELCQIARELNTMFGTQMTMEMVSYMIFLTRLCDFIIKHVTGMDFAIPPFHWLDMQFWVYFYVARLFCLNYVCENVSAKANEIQRIIHQLTDFLRYADIRDEIYQFTLQVIQHPLKFSGLGLFYFGNGFLRKFFMRITTFVIIIIQTIPKKYMVFKKD